MCKSRQLRLKPLLTSIWVLETAVSNLCAACPLYISSGHSQPLLGSIRVFRHMFTTITYCHHDMKLCHHCSQASCHQMSVCKSWKVACYFVITVCMYAHQCCAFGCIIITLCTLCTKGYVIEYIYSTCIYMYIPVYLSFGIFLINKFRKGAHGTFLSPLCCECDGQLSVHSTLTTTSVYLLALVYFLGVVGPRVWSRGMLQDAAILHVWFSGLASMRLLRLDSMCSAEPQCSIAAHTVIWKCMLSSHRVCVLWNLSLYVII